MQVYILDKEFRTKALIDSFVSLIWTDRYYGEGEFEMEMLVDTPYLSSIEYEDYLYLRESEHLMIIETIEITTNFEEGDRLHLTGRSLESILRRRIVWEKSKLYGDFQDNIIRLINANIINAKLKKRNIPNFMYEKSTDPYILSQTVELELYGENLYDVIYSLCVDRGIGFKVTLTNDGNFKFSLYSGTDRSYNQSERPWIVFSPHFENLIGTDFIESRANLITAALVYNESGRYQIDPETGEEVSVETTTEVISNNYPYNNLARREIFVEDSTTEEKIDKSEWGEAKDYVNVRDYQELVVVDTHRSEYEENVEKYGENSIFTGDPEDYYEYDWDFKWGGEDAYNQAVNAEQSRIDSEYNQAVANSESVFRNSMAQAGYNTLAKYVVQGSFDGELQSLNQYILGRDFFIGDVVQVQNSYGMEGVSRVIEIVRAHDISGEYTYPTFSGT